MKKLALVLMVALAASSFSFVSSSFAQGKVVRVSLIDENGSGEDGSAQLTDMGDGTTKVELIMLNAPEGADQPAHIHKGSCANLDPKPAYPLTDVKEGKSTTTVKVSLADLAKDKYAINVHKSAAEVSVYVSCGNLPQGTSASGPMTMDQVLSTLLDNANELLGTIKKKEADASKNAYTIYHDAFAAHEEEIKAKSADTQKKLEDVMHEVRDAIQAGDFNKAAAAAGNLVKEVNDAYSEIVGSTSASKSGSQASTSIMDVMSEIKAAAADVQRETKNADKDGSQKAYDDFHTLFAANEDAIKTKSADAQAHIENAMHEVRDAIQAGDLSKAATAANDLVKEVDDAYSKIGGTSSSSLPTSGSGEIILMLYALIGASLALVVAGTTLRRRTVR